VLPFVIRSVSVSVANLDPALERAAASLGARPARVFRRVTLPLLRPGLAAAALFAVIVSVNELVVSLFVSTRVTEILPVAMFTYVVNYTDPTMAALSTLFIAATFVAVVAAERWPGLSRVLGLAGHARGGPDGGRGSGTRGPRARSPAGRRRPTPRAALRRPAAARRPGARARDPPARAAARRTAGRAGPQAARGDARRAEGDPACGGDDDGVRHPRPARGARPLRPRGRHAPRAHRAARHARGRLRASGHGLRRRLRRRPERTPRPR